MKKYDGAVAVCHCRDKMRGIYTGTTSVRKRIVKWRRVFVSNLISCIFLCFLSPFGCWVGCRGLILIFVCVCWWLLMVPGWRLSGVGCWLCWLSFSFTLVLPIEGWQTACHAGFQWWLSVVYVAMELPKACIWAALTRAAKTIYHCTDYSCWQFSYS